MHFHFRQTSAVVPFVFAATFLLCACSPATGSPQEEKEAESKVASVSDDHRAGDGALLTTG